MMKYKHFIKISLVLIFLYLLFHLFIWEKYTSNIFGRDDGKYVGDIARVSYQIDALSPRKLEFTLPKRHLSKEQFKNTNIDIITVGDSFSHGVTGGKNPYYQDYIASIYNKNVLNMTQRAHGELKFFEPIITLCNNDWFKKRKPKFVIIESVERFIIPRFARDFNFSQNNFKIIDNYVSSSITKNSYIPKLQAINTANYKFIYYNLFYHHKPNVHELVVKLNLDKNAFSTETFKNKLLIHNEDIVSLQYYNEKVVNKINKNFNLLAQKLKKLNIQLIFLIGVDKYDLYSDDIINNPFQKNKFFSLIRPLKKEYIFIDTKKILKELLDQNVTDIYYSDDTHWSYKASEAIVKSKAFKKIFEHAN